MPRHQRRGLVADRAVRHQHGDIDLVGLAAGEDVRRIDVESQSETLELALCLLESAPAPRTTVQSPQRWSEDASWKLDYHNLAKLTPEEIAERRREFDAVKAVIATKPDRK